MKASANTFTGFTLPRYTQVPDELFDELMDQLSGAELKVLLYIIRRTFGFKKEFDNISLSQICRGITTREGEVIDNGTGLSQQSVITALKGLVSKHAIIATRRASKEKGNEPTTYSLNLKTYSKNLTTPSPKIREALPQKLEIQETVEQKTDLQIRNSKAQSQTERPKRGESIPTSLADILAKRQPLIEHPTPPGKFAPTPQILAAVTEISTEFGDTNHLRPNTSQALNIWQESGKSETAFVSSLFEARSITRLQKKVRRPMPYFWRVVRDLVGLHKDLALPAG